MKNDNQVQVISKYQWDPAADPTVAHMNIESVISELQAIEDTHQDVSIELIIESSKNKQSALYHYFEWDNEKAADAWRKLQAANLIRSIQIKVINDGESRRVDVYETTNRLPSIGNGQTRRVNLPAPDDRELIKKRSFSELLVIKNRLILHSLSDAAEYVSMAMQELLH